MKRQHLIAQLWSGGRGLDKPIKVR